MALNSLEYKTLLNEFEEDLQEINDALYKATKPATPQDKRDKAVQTAQAKLRGYDELLAKLDGAQRKRAETDFGELIEEMREYVSQLSQDA